MSGIFDQIINYSPPLIVSGTVNYKGTWNASTNNPPLSNPPVASTKGDYYVVSTAGTQFSISFAVGDWIISSGTAWEKVDLTDAVSSVFGRTGAVVGVSTDYSAVGLTNTAIGASSPSTGAFTTVTASSTIAATGAVTGSNLSGTNTGDQTTISGNAGSATILQTARNINGVSFNGSADITVAAAAGTLTGATLASGVTASSLTSVGTIASLVATTADINGGTIDATTIGATTPSTGAFTTLSASGLLTVNNTGGTAPTFPLPMAIMVGTSTNRVLGMAAYGGNPAILGRRANGTVNSPTALLSGENAFVVRSGGYGSTGFDGGNGASIQFPATENWTDSGQGQNVIVTATAIGSNVSSPVGTFSSTGLAVTGALSATAAYGSLAITSSTGTNGADVRFINTGGTYYVGVDSSTGSGFGATAYDMIHFLPTGRGLSTVINGSGVVTRVSSTGLAVTGALSATGRVSTLAGTNVSLTNSRNDNVAIGTAGFFRFLGGGASAEISGMAAGTDGQQITVFNATGSNIVFLYDDANSTAANRIYVDGGVSITLANAGAIAFIYLAVSSRWVFVGKP